MLNRSSDGLPEQETAEERKKIDKSRMELYDWLQCLVSALVVGILLFVFAGRVVNVRGTSMYDTLNNGDKVICSKLFYTPKRGDIVVFRPENDHVFDYSLVKRIVAVGGQTVSIDFAAGVVYVDGQALDEPYTFAPTTSPEDFTDPVTVPQGKLFVMGDNRNASTDSRSNLVGLVDERDVIGKVLWIIFPGKNEQDRRDFGRLGSAYRE